MINWVAECGNSTPSSKLMSTEQNDAIQVDEETIHRGPVKPGCKERILPFVKASLSVIAHAGFLVSVGVIIWCFVVAHKNSDRTFYIAFSLLAAFCYVIILIEAAASDVYTALRHFSDKLNAEDYIDKVKSARPQVKWQAECYHYEYSESDDMNAENGHKQPRLGRRKRQRIITGHDKEVFQFTRWKDYTRDIKDLLTKPVIRFECSKVFIFNGEHSKSQYLQQYQAFRERIRRRDEFLEHEEEMTIPGYHKTLTAPLNRSEKPCWLADSIFWICTMLLLTWPYRLAFRKHSSKVYILFVKQLEITN